MRKQAKFIGVRAREDYKLTGMTKGKLYPVDTSWAFHDKRQSEALDRDTYPWAGGPYRDDHGQEGWVHIIPGRDNAYNVAMVFEVHV